MLVADGKRCVAAAGLESGVALACEDSHYHASHVRVVLDNEDCLYPAFDVGQRCSVQVLASTSGRYASKVLPLKSWLFTVMYPPCCFMMP